MGHVAQVSNPMQLYWKWGCQMVQRFSSRAIVCLMISPLISPAVSFAQEPAELLPPPPTTSPLTTTPLPGGSEPEPAPLMPESPPPGSETVFQAPIDLQKARSERYVVLVNGDSPYLLQQVQLVEANAFVRQHQGRRVIQVGTFSNEANAREQVTLLNRQGIRAEIAANQSLPGGANAARYLVVVPGDGSSLSALADEAIRLGIRRDAVQQKEAPLGPHLEIGPFAAQGEAEDLNRFLRKSGMDSRVYYRR